MGSGLAIWFSYHVLMLYDVVWWSCCCMMVLLLLLFVVVAAAVVVAAVVVVILLVYSMSFTWHGGLGSFVSLFKTPLSHLLVLNALTLCGASGIVRQRIPTRNIYLIWKPCNSLKMVEVWYYWYLLMEEILHHLPCVKPSKWWDKLPTSAGERQISEPSTVGVVRVTMWICVSRLENL